MNEINDQIKKCQNAISIINNGVVTVGLRVGPRTHSFLAEMLKLASFLPELEKEISIQINEDVNKIKSEMFINPFAFGRLQAYLKYIAVVHQNEMTKKIFISHSSKDIKIVNAFVTLLVRGAGFSEDDIFCTSIAGMKIENGYDIREHILNNIRGVDYSILLVSKNYKKSEVCLNEMGAVWAIGKKIKTYVFPDLREKEIGWILNHKASEKINDMTALASLYEDLSQYYKLPHSLQKWTAQSDIFCRCF